MSEYQFLFYRPDGRRPTFALAACRDDSSALSQAVRELADHVSCNGVEIYRGPHLIARLEPEARVRGVRRP